MRSKLPYKEGQKIVLTVDYDQAFDRRSGQLREDFHLSQIRTDRLGNQEHDHLKRKVTNVQNMYKNSKKIITVSPKHFKKYFNKIELKFLAKVAKADKTGFIQNTYTNRRTFDDEFKFLKWANSTTKVFVSVLKEQRRNENLKLKESQKEKAKSEAENVAHENYHRSPLSKMDLACASHSVYNSNMKKIKSYRKMGVYTLKTGKLINQNVELQQKKNRSIQIYTKQTGKKWSARNCPSASQTADRMMKFINFF
jgi:hypothetical protein